MDVYLFGAGASAAEGAPTTNDFFTKAWEFLAPGSDPLVRAVWSFLETVFRVPIDSAEAFTRIPAVDEVFSLVDWCLHADQGLGPCYPPPELNQVKRALEHLLCVTLNAVQATRSGAGDGPHARFARALFSQAGPSALITMNYDTLLDDALLAAGAPPDYGFRDLDLGHGRGVLLAKLHGSLNWALCPACDHVQVVGASRSACERCTNPHLQGVIISPTWLKSYTAAQLRHVWDLALECIQRAERLIFVGYSMPPADVAIYQLIRRGLLARLAPGWPRIEVINHCDPAWSPAERQLHEASVIRRFTRLFGGGVAFDFDGFRGQTEVP